MALTPVFSITPETAKALLAIDASRTVMDSLPVISRHIASSRVDLRFFAIQYPTQFEGDRFALLVLEQIIEGHNAFPCLPFLGKQTPYDDGQNLILKVWNRPMDYLRPEAKKIHFLMRELIEWTNNRIAFMGELRPWQSQTLDLFIQNKILTAVELAGYFDIGQRQGLELCANGGAEALLVVENLSKKARCYHLAERYEEVLA